MAASESCPLADIPRLLIRSGVLGVRGFWKLSSLSKGLLKSRDDVSLLGLGSVCCGFASVFEREQLEKLLRNCLEYDNVRSLQQILALGGILGRCPSVMRWGQHMDAHKCVEALTKMEPVSVVQGFVVNIYNLTPKALAGMQQQGSVQPNSWIERYGQRVRDSTFQPLLNLLIEKLNFECAELLLDAGARVDVADLKCNFDSGRFQIGWSPLQTLVLLLVGWHGEAMRLTKSSRKRGLSLLKRLAIASKSARCLDWTVSERNFTVCILKAREETSLGVACMGCEPEVVRILLEVGLGGAGGSSRLPMMALGGGWMFSGTRADDLRSADVLSQLADAGVHMDARGERGKEAKHTPLSRACGLGLHRCAKVLLERGARVGGARISGGSDFFRLPLHEALTCGKHIGVVTSLVKSLLKWGADPNAVGPMENTNFGQNLIPMQVALFAVLESQKRVTKMPADGVYELLKILIDAGARCSLPAGVLPQGVDVSQLSPLGMACMAHETRLVRLLCVEGGADPNAAGGVPKVGELCIDFPLQFAVCTSVWGPSGMRRDCASQKDEGAAVAEIVEILADAGANLDQRNERGRNVLLSACANGLEEAVKALLERGVSVKGMEVESRFAPKARCGATVSIEARRTPLIETLNPQSDLADQNFKGSENGLIPASVRFRIAVALLLHGADPNEIGVTRVDSGLHAITPLQLAVSLEALGEGRYKLVKALIDQGARCPFSSEEGVFRERDEEGPCDTDDAAVYPTYKWPPLLVACEDLDPDLVRLLCKEGGADPNSFGGTSVAAVSDERGEGEKEPLRPLEFVLFGTDSSKERARVSDLWDVVKTLVEVGADPSHLSSVSQTKSVEERIRILGKLVGVECSHGPLLEEIIRAVSLTGDDGGGVEETPCQHPLVSALKGQWQAGVIALVESGASVNFVGEFGDDKGGRRCSAVLYALDSGQWELAENLILRGGRLGLGESLPPSLLDEASSQKLSAGALQALGVNGARDNRIA
uniref:Uncharacterized protein n=1 Tax=Chromera velia CCMP2878 TaxID=1169474 RepID=A0A0G4HCQ4_9ALVE|eukprot:Cvel_946.t1-p1 / transcript=Cvel_946.t1 / gene=Cvel_946 / organism=Chromera_velia_CCMP2878 / gene_product=Ankyrin repeat domain-containing protein 17, putative / transcript_product=Ankyrin repeat domain-containing protein 17, putative / location=Cvel_scaffold30:121335-124521(-) / protein_length=998 / sequence_SO=supercontig / SO=protein_coding / is_pseudo=false